MTDRDRFQRRSDVKIRTDVKVAVAVYVSIVVFMFPAWMRLGCPNIFWWMTGGW